MSLTQGIKAVERAAPVSLTTARSSRRLAVALTIRVSETVAVDRLRRSIVAPTIAENRGTLVRGTGCNLLAVFDLPEDAVRCAVVLRNLLSYARGQPSTEDRITFRFGVELGELFLKADAVSGAAVTISEQLAASARAGEIYISGSVHAQIANRLACQYRSHGDNALDGVAHPVRIYGVSPLPVLGETRAMLTYLTEAIAMSVAVVPERACYVMRSRMNALAQLHIPEGRRQKISLTSSKRKLVFGRAATIPRVIVYSLRGMRATVGPMCWFLVVLFWRLCITRGPGAWA